MTTAELPNFITKGKGNMIFGGIVQSLKHWWGPRSVVSYFTEKTLRVEFVKSRNLTQGKGIF